MEKGGQLGRGVSPKKFGVLPAKRAADLGRELPLVYFATDDTTSYIFFCARLLFSSFPSFMFHPARSHGRALNAVLQPCARLNLAINIGKPTWNGRLQQRQNWTRSRGRPTKESYQAEYAAAKKLKETGIFVSKKTHKTKPKYKKSGPSGDGSRVSLVNTKLASMMLLPSGVPPPPQQPVRFRSWAYNTTEKLHC